MFSESIPLHKGLIGLRISAHVQTKKNPKNLDFNNVSNAINIIELEGTPKPL